MLVTVKGQQRLYCSELLGAVNSKKEIGFSHASTARRWPNKFGLTCSRLDRGFLSTNPLVLQDKRQVDKGAECAPVRLEFASHSRPRASLHRPVVVTARRRRPKAAVLAVQ